jgi:hypothetical protein
MMALDDNPIRPMALGKRRIRSCLSSAILVTQVSGLLKVGNLYNPF